LNFISKEIDYKLIPLNNLTDQEATQLTGLKGNSLNLMRDRHWSMPFLNPPTNLDQKINICCKKFKVDIFKGNRMSHLLSINLEVDLKWPQLKHLVLVIEENLC